MTQKRITIGITGSIAAYKIPYLIRAFKKSNYSVRCILSDNAKNFITPLTLETLSGNRVCENQFDPSIPHIDIENETDLFVLAPLTANTIGKMAHGIADDLLTSTIIASRKPVLMVPAMNTGMWENRIVQENIQKLITLENFHMLEPAYGELACRRKGKGRLPDLADIFLESEKLLKEQDLKNKNICINCGPTREHIDPVRFMSNHSSGKMGKALALEAYKRGANVLVICGPTDISLPSQIKKMDVISNIEMEKAIQEHFSWMDVFVSSAAIADFKTKEISHTKMKKKEKHISLKLEQTTDILKKIAKKKGNKKMIGFALESHSIEENALKKMNEKQLDMIIANNIQTMGSDHIEGIIMNNKGEKSPLQKLPKEQFAQHIFDWAMSH